MTDRRLWLFTFLGFALLFLTTAHWWGTMSVDTKAADYASWRLAHTGSLDLSGVRDLPANPFFVPAGERIIPDRTMGVILLGVPLQLLLSPLRLSPDVAGVMTAALCAAATLANVLLTLVKLGARRLQALSAASVLGLGTAVWTVASTELWSHTASLLWLSTMLLALSVNRLSWAALTTIPLVWSRPHLALVPAAIGIGILMENRRIRPALAFAVAGLISLGGLWLWNDWIYGHPSLTGAYYGQYVGPRLTATSGAAASSWLENLLGTVFSPLRGVLLYSPITALAAVCAVYGWRRCPAWVRGAAVGGLAYLAVQLKLNDFTGGAAFFGNRLILESLLLATPLAFLGYVDIAKGRPRVHVLAKVLAGISVTIHLTGALLSGAAPNYIDPIHPWRTWLLWQDLQATRLAGVLILVAGAVVAAAVTGAPRLARTLRGRMAL